MKGRKGPKERKGLYFFWSFWFFLSLFLSGCNLAPSYDSNPIDVPEHWKSPHEVIVTDSCVDFWWEIFDDSVLNDLEQKVIENNPNLYIALQKIFEARAMAGVEEANLYPQATLNPSYSNTGTLFKLYGIPKKLVSEFGIKPIIRIHQLLYTFPLNMSYELDLWGRLRGQYAAALLNVQAQEQAYQTTMLTLTSDLASNYFNMRSLDAQAELLEKTILIRKKNLKLTEERFQKGIITYLDVAEATVDLYNNEAEYQDTLRQRHLMENAIAYLIGVAPSELCLDVNPLIGDPPLIPAGIPASIIANRPDIREAERTMASENALIGVAYASFLPSFNLTGALGFSSPDLSLFMEWKGRYWNIGGNIAQTFFDGGRKYSNLGISWARYEEAVGKYQQRVLKAFQEVEDALNDIEWKAKSFASLAVSSQASSKATELSKKRYLRGVTNYLEVIINERSELDVRRSYINLLGQRYQSTIQLIKSLGGSWDCEDVRTLPQSQ